MGHENRGIVVAFRDGIWGAGVAEEKGFPLYFIYTLGILSHVPIVHIPNKDIQFHFFKK